MNMLEASQYAIRALKYSPSMTPGLSETVLPSVRRVLCDNPGLMTECGTNTWLVGEQQIAVIDPGPTDPRHLHAILRATAGQVITHILVTHRHLDHAGGAMALSRAVGAPIYAYKAAASDRHGGRQGAEVFIPDIGLKHGDTLNIEGRNLTVIHTPGHCPTHVCFAMNPGSVLFSGDQIMAWAVTAITPPDGNLAEYLSSLELISHQDVETCLPAHGVPITDLRRLATRYATQIHSREQRVLSCLSRLRRGTCADIALQIYGDLLDSDLGSAVLGTLRTHLLHLAAQRKVFENDGTWFCV